MADINGIPYVEATDLVSAYPGTSLALATELDTQLGSKVDYPSGGADGDALIKSGTDAVWGTAGKILQVVSTAKTDTFSASVSSAAFSSDAFTASITPSSTASKILVIGFMIGSTSAEQELLQMRLTRAGSPIGVADAASNRALLTSSHYGSTAQAQHHANVAFSYLDSPNTTSSTTYGVQLYNSSSITRTVYLNRTQADTDNFANMRSISTLTLMEVAA
jgi:hypothetical protein